MCMKGGTRKRGKTWSYYFDAATIDGKRKKKEKGGFRTKKEAETALAQALSEYNHSGLTFEPSSISVSDYLDYWMNEHCVPNLSENTVATYRSIIENHLKPQFGGFHLSALQSASIQKYINTLKQQGFSKSSITVILCILSASIKYAIEPMHYIKDNPCTAVRVGTCPKEPKKRVVLTSEEYQRMIDLFPFGNRYYMMLVIGWNCGMRIGECTGLVWEDIDLSSKTISVQRQIVYSKINDRYEYIRILPKYNSIRKIKFGDTLLHTLNAEKKRQQENELLYGSEYTVYYVEAVISNGFEKLCVRSCKKSQIGNRKRIYPVCIDENGKLNTKFNFNICQNKIRVQVKPGFDFHALRHTHATKLIESGVNVKSVQTRLGHKNITTTLNTYTHHTDIMDQEAADIFESVVNGSIPCLPPR